MPESKSPPSNTQSGGGKGGKLDEATIKKVAERVWKLLMEDLRRERERSARK